MGGGPAGQSASRKVRAKFRRGLVADAVAHFMRRAAFAFAFLVVIPVGNLLLHFVTARTQGRPNPVRLSQSWGLHKENGRAFARYPALRKGAEGGWATRGVSPLRAGKEFLRYTAEPQPESLYYLSPCIRYDREVREPIQSAAGLRRELSARNLARAETLAHESTYGAVPSVVYAEE